MRFRNLRLVLCVLIPLSAVSGLHAKKRDLERIQPVPATEQIPVMDFFRPSLFTSPTLNRAGTHIAARVTLEDDSISLLIYDLKTQKLETLAGGGDKDIYQIRWLDDQRLLFGLSGRKLYGLGLLAAEIGHLRNAYPLLQYCGARLISVPENDRTRPLVWISSDGFQNGRDQGVARIRSDIKTGKIINLLAAGSDRSDALEARDNNERHVVSSYPVPKQGVGYGYLADKMGNLAFAFMADGGEPAMYRLAGETWEKCPVDLETTDVLACGNQPGEVLVLAPSEPGKVRAVQFMDAATGRLGDVLLQDAGYDFGGWLYRDPVTHDVVGAVYDRNGPAAVWFEPSYRELQKILDGFFPGVIVRILGSDTTKNQFLVETFSDRQPTIYYWVNLEKKTVGLIKNSKPWIDPKRMQPTSILKFKTRDGHMLDAYVTLPTRTSKQHPAPLVVLSHGGPWVRDTWGYDGEVQFLASRGYAVLQTNYRGSPGYNWMFPESDQWDFIKMSDDVSDATRTLLRTGLIDASRVAIMGGSFGAYLALSGVERDPSLYRCAVTIAGVFDWARMIKQEKYYQFDNPSYGRLMRKLGDPKMERDKFDAISPVRHVDRVHVPIFVAHGKEDEVADIEQSRRLVSELKKYQVEHEVMFVGGEGHGMHHLDNQVELYTRIEAFLAKHLAPVGTAVATTTKP